MLPRRRVVKNVGVLGARATARFHLPLVRAIRKMHGAMHLPTAIRQLAATADDMGRVSGYRDTSAARSAISPNFVLTAASFSKDTSAAEAHSEMSSKTAAFDLCLNAQRKKETCIMWVVHGSLERIRIYFALWESVQLDVAKHSSAYVNFYRF